MKRLFALCLIASFACCLYAQWLARGNGIAVDTADYTSWLPVLRDSGELNHLSVRAHSEGLPLQQVIVRHIALIQTLGREAAATLEPRRRQAIEREIALSLYFQPARRALLGQAPEPSEQEISAYFGSHYATHRSDRGAVVYELFVWAPAGLPRLRSRQLARLRGIAAGITDLDSFKQAARRHSDATSANKQGYLGCLWSSQLSGDLNTVLFTGAEGMRDIVTTPDGAYLFYVESYRSKQAPTLQEKRPAIRAALSGQSARRQYQDLLARLKREYALDMKQQDTFTSADLVAHTSRGDFQLQDLFPDKEDMPFAAAEERLHRLLVLWAWQEGGAVIDSMRIQRHLLLRLYQQVFNRRFAALYQNLRKDQAFLAKVRQALPGDLTTRTISVSLLTVNGPVNKQAFSRLFFVYYCLPSFLSLETIADMLSDAGMAVDVRRLDNLAFQQAVSLGPEIHDALKELAAGDTSKPLFIASRPAKLAMVRLRSETSDTAVSPHYQAVLQSTFNRQVEERQRRDLLRRLALEYNQEPLGRLPRPDAVAAQ